MTESCSRCDTVLDDDVIVAVSQWLPTDWGHEVGPSNDYCVSCVKEMSDGLLEEADE